MTDLIEKVAREMEHVKEDGKTMTLLDPKEDGVGGVVLGKSRRRKQDKRARSAEMYAVIFFPKVTGIGKANVNFFGVQSTLAQSPEAARVRFMDRIAPGESWESYHKAGHRVRKVKILDMGDAE